MDWTQKQSQAHRQILNPAMRQSLEILQMSLWDLRELVAAQLDGNPLLEAAEGGEAIPEWEPVPLQQVEEWERFDGEPGGLPGVWTGDPPQAAQRGEDFCGVLREQIRTMGLTRRMERICCYLVDCLDRRGYLDCFPEEAAAALGLPVEEVLQALYVVQSLTPCGVGARSLEECLILQLAQGKSFGSDTLAIVSRGLELLAANKTRELGAMLRRPMGEVLAACAAVRDLNPIPSRGYDTGELVFPAIPDAWVSYEDNRLSIRMNDRFVPRLTLSGAYDGLDSGDLDESAVAFLRENEARARSLLLGLRGRTQTLLRVLGRIAALQPRFFAAGTGLRPMTMGEIARGLGLDLSTISRAVAHKHIVCAAGTVSLRSLFVGGYDTAGGGQLSAAMVREKLRELVERENPAAPLTDEDLRLALLAAGIPLARRTVVKYRGQMGIAPSGQRKVPEPGASLER